MLIRPSNSPASDCEPRRRALVGSRARHEPLVWLRPVADETFELLPHAGQQLYCVRHACRGEPRAVVVLAGPFGLERQTSYITWVRWARLLAAEQFEVVHFDYRGMGESSGPFDAMTMSDWIDDLRICHGFALGKRSLPTVWVGLRMGALLAAELFSAGIGGAMLLWAPPASAQALLTDTLRRKLASDLLESVPGPRKSREAYIHELMSGATVDVEGFPWTQRLWTNAALHPLRLPSESERRPWMAIQLDATPPSAALDAKHHRILPVGKPPFWGHDPYVLPDLSELFCASLQFIRDTVACQEAS
jgi:pimeloyl-ACP methyl ester carboxylesterase